MNNIVPILVKFASILTAVCVSAVFAAEREYVVPMEKSEWQSSAKEQYECTLSQDIPFFGKASFVHKSGRNVKFNLFSDEPVLKDDVAIVIQSEPPSWRHDDRIFEIGKFKLERGHNPLIVKSPHASRMLQQVENGMSPVVIYRDLADGRDIIAVMLSPINFRKALSEYRDCEKTLLAFDLDEIKDLKIYFATNKANLTRRSKQDLNNILDYLKMDPSILQIKVTAHADSRGRRRFNDNLAKQRSQSVVDYLLSIGIKKEMIYAVNYGERKSIHSNKTASGRSKNRRVDVQLLTTAPPTAEEQKILEAERKAQRRSELTERSIFNRPTMIKPPATTKDSQQKSDPVVSNSEPVKAPSTSEPVDVDVPDDEPPAPNFINFDHLVDKNNQKVKSK